MHVCVNSHREAVVFITKISFSSFTASGDERKWVFSAYGETSHVSDIGRTEETNLDGGDVGQCGLWSTCIRRANFLNRLANRTSSGQGALGLVLEDGGGEFL